jgi:hypothetical protein
MAVSGTYGFNPQLADHIDEAFERCGIDPAELKARHIRSAIRSANLTFVDWQNFGYKQHTLEFLSQPLVAGTNTFTLPVGGLDIFPDRYFVDRSTFLGDAPASTVRTWQSPENSTDTIEMWYIRRLQDAGKMSNTLDLTPNYQEAFACALAFHLSRKYAPERSSSLKDDYLGENYDEYKNSSPGGAMGRAMAEDRDTGDAVLRVRFDRYRGRR